MREDIYNVIQNIKITNQLTLDIKDNNDYEYMIDLLSNSYEASCAYIEACNSVATLNSYSDSSYSKESLDRIRNSLMCLNCDKSSTC